jgi:hypothetical protein
VDYIICHSSSCQFVRHAVFFGIPSFHVCIDIIPGLSEMTEIGQGMRVWFSIVWGSPPLGFPGDYITESLAQACQASNGNAKLSSSLGKTNVSDN